MVQLGRLKLGYPYWSLSGYLKHKVKHRGQFIANYEKALVEEARRRGVDGVVCGHIHYPEQKILDGILYYNDGDWVDNRTALVEHHPESWSCCAGPRRPPSGRWPR